MIDRIEKEIGFHRTALNLRDYRQELLASNIANADTPHFKARDIDFRSALASAMAGKNQGPVELARTAVAHLPGAGDSRYGAMVKYRTEYQGAVDGNTVNMDVERASFAENAMHTEALLTFIRENFRMLSTAMQSQ